MVYISKLAADSHLDGFLSQFVQRRQEVASQQVGSGLADNGLRVDWKEKR